MVVIAEDIVGPCWMTLFKPSGNLLQTVRAMPHNNIGGISEKSSPSKATNIELMSVRSMFFSIPGHVDALVVQFCQ